MFAAYYAPPFPAPPMENVVEARTPHDLDVSVAANARDLAWSPGVVDADGELAAVRVHASAQDFLAWLAHQVVNEEAAAEAEEVDADELELSEEDSGVHEVPRPLPRPAPSATAELPPIPARHRRRSLVGDSPVVPPPRPRTGSVRPPPMPTARTSELPQIPAPGAIPRSAAQARSAPQPFVPSSESQAPKPSGDEVADFMSDLLSQHAEAARAEDGVRRTSAEWYAEVFDDTWLRLLPERQARRTASELRFLHESVDLGTSRDILDLACGPGRHAIELAAQGHRVTGVDLSTKLLRAAHHLAESRGIDLRLLQGDMRHIDFQEAFDLVISMDTSFGYFDDRTNFDVLQAMARALRPGGSLLLDALNREHVVARTPRSLWWEVDGIRLMEDVQFRAHSSVLEVLRTLVVPGEVPWEQKFQIRLYALHEWRAMLAMAGLEVREISGSVYYRGATLGAEDRRTILLASRP